MLYIIYRFSLLHNSLYVSVSRFVRNIEIVENDRKRGQKSPKTSKNTKKWQKGEKGAFIPGFGENSVFGLYEPVPKMG